MEFINSTIAISHQNSPQIPFFSPKSFIYTSKNRVNPCRLSIPTSRKFPFYPSSSLYLFNPLSSKKFKIEAHFSRPTNRQNYLRKKLTQQQQTLQKVSYPQNPVEEFDKDDNYESNNNNSSEERRNFEKRSSLGTEFDSYSEESKSLGSNYEDSEGGFKESEVEIRKKQFGESIMWNKLESWVEQYKKDSEFWGVGTGPIFTVYQHSEGKVERVVVNEDEILRRSEVDRESDGETEELSFKLSFAKDLAKEMENGGNVIPKSSSVAKFLSSGGELAKEMVNGGNVIPQSSSVAKFLSSGGESGYMDTIWTVIFKPGFFSRMSRVGVLVLCGLLVAWTFKRVFTNEEGSEEYTRLEKEMLRRKMKARTVKEKMEKGSVEVVLDPVESRSLSLPRPQLDKEELVNSINQAKGSTNGIATVEYPGYNNKEFKDKIEEIRAMARHAREIEKKESLVDEGVGEDDQTSLDSSTDPMSPEDAVLIPNGIVARDSDETVEPASFTTTETDVGQSNAVALLEKTEIHNPDVHNVVVVTPNVTESSRSEVSNMIVDKKSSDTNEANLHSDDMNCQSRPHGNSSRRKLRIIKSVEEAREYLSRKHQRPKVPEIRNDEEHDNSMTMSSEIVAPSKTSNILDLNGQVYDSSSLNGRHVSSFPSENCNSISETAAANVDSQDDSRDIRITPISEVNVNNQETETPIFEMPGEEAKNKTKQKHTCSDEVPSFLGNPADSTANEVDHVGSIQTEQGLDSFQKHYSAGSEENKVLIGDEVIGRTTESGPLVNKENWIEKNFHEFEHIFEKMGVGFRDNYLVAREKANQELDPNPDINQLKSDGDEHELEWMKDERLREIVFTVRDNELSGRDPFHLMNEKDKSLFLSGLEKKVEQENEKLLKLHEYFHSNIENLDYGADGISLYDPPEKIIPRWKVPPAESNPEFLNNFLEQRKTLVADSLKNSLLANKTGKDVAHKSEEPSSHENMPVEANVSDQRAKLQNKPSVSSKTIIESSDGSVKAGRKSGREYWEHTKKWSQGFLESYSAETDPEVKSVMQNMGKDLDRWITEKEIQEAADLMDKIPEKGQKFVKGKLDKVKREMELFGPQAVVSKYREYAEEKEEDHLWWLDLPAVLCIELYTVDNGEQRVGFYSLEMAADLELDPKQYHVIAFEDAGDCKNLCYILQAHMEFLGNGNAFVVARPPKDAFREAKANGFSVTVIRKGQLKLNIDQTLEEVEELIIEIGSKIYHDKIMKERSVDVNALMKGVFGVSKPAKRKRSKRKLKRRTKK